MLPLHVHETVKATLLLPTNKDKNYEWFFNHLVNIVISLVRLNDQSELSDEEIKANLSETIHSLMKPINVLVNDEGAFDPNWTTNLNRSAWEYWPALYTFLGKHRSPVRSPSVLASLDSASDNVLSQLGSPHVVGQRFGLVIGYVQSGKTENFTALIAKAADSGYRLIIVLSGIDDEIRRQTQGRIRTHIWGVDDQFSSAGVKYPTRRWHELTGTNDFTTPPTIANNMLGDDRPTCLVIKKNGQVLQRVLTWLEGARPEIKENLPVLIIDDEADQASPNVATVNPDDRPSVINRRIRSILNTFNRSRYVAYTATPFANFFINTERNNTMFGDDLYPRDFIFSLPSPVEYMGSADVYGLPPGILRDGLEVKRFNICVDCTDNPSEISAVNSDKLVGLTSAVHNFLFGTAFISLVKGNDNFPSSMIVHASHLNASQNKHSEAIDAILDNARAAANGLASERFKKKFEQIYSDMLTQKINLAKDCNFPFPNDVPTFDDVWTKVLYYLQDGALDIRTVNSSSASMPKWDTTEPNIKSILIGGNLLSRGLTIPNLLSSYFMRNPEQADTMLQMARWLGYRKDIAYLMNVYATKECHEDLLSIAAAEQDIRNQISEMRRQGKKPIDFQFVVRIRAGLIPTRTNAMRNATLATISANYAGELLETFCFNENNLPALKYMASNNMSLLIRTLDGCQSVTRTSVNTTNYSVTSIDAKVLIDDLQLTADEPSLGTNSTGTNNLKLVRDYITKRMEDGELVDWEIVVCSLSNSSQKYPNVELPKGISVTPVQRGREKNSPTERSTKLKNVGVGSDEYDSLLDEERSYIDSELESRKESKSNGSLIRRLRSPLKGKIFVYPITKYSNQPGYAPAVRHDSALFLPELLSEAPDVIFAFGISLPGSSKADQQAVGGYINETTI